MPARRSDTNAKVYLVGGGIASLAAAAFFIRDGNIPGHNITILEESRKIGGSLDAGGNPVDGYIMRGGRMLESKYLCTYDLFSSIPTLDRSKTVTQEIFELNKLMKTSSKSRLVRGGQRINAPRFGLSERHILTIERLRVEPESILGRSSISDQFEPSFFETDFWAMWCTTFAFQPWHSAVELKRYLARFVHMVSGFNTLSGILRTVYNQYDSMVRPLQKWLEEHGVKSEFNASVTNLGFCHDAEGFTVDRSVFVAAFSAIALLFGTNLNPSERAWLIYGCLAVLVSIYSLYLRACSLPSRSCFIPQKQYRSLKRSQSL